MVPLQRAKEKERIKAFGHISCILCGFACLPSRLQLGMLPTSNCLVYTPAYKYSYPSFFLHLLADIRVHEFFKTSYFKTGIHPIPGSQQTLQKLSRFCNLSIVTSRQNAIKDHTIEWIERHYPGLFQEMHFGNHFALNGQSIAKSDICRSLGANVLIDDNPRYAIECAEVGIKVLLFDYENSYPWSKSESLNGHPMVKKVHNWGEVEHQLASWIVPTNSSPK